MSSKAKTLARRLLRENRGTRSHASRSWRVMAREDYQNKIPAGTLCRFAKAEGEWMPSDEHQIILGLKHERKAKTHKPCDLFDMQTHELLKALQTRETVPPINPRMFNAFKRAGFFSRSKARPTA